MVLLRPINPGEWLLHSSLNRELLRVFMHLYCQTGDLGAESKNKNCNLADFCYFFRSIFPSLSWAMSFEATEDYRPRITGHHATCKLWSPLLISSECNVVALGSCLQPKTLGIWFRKGTRNATIKLSCFFLRQEWLKTHTQTYRK